MEIKYKGETLDTIHYKQMSDDKFFELKRQYYEKPKFEDVKNQIIQIAWGVRKTTK